VLLLLEKLLQLLLGGRLLLLEIAHLVRVRVRVRVS